MKKRDEEYYRRMLKDDPSGSVAVALAARAICAARPHMQSDNYVRWLTNHYGKSLTTAQVLKLMDGE